MSGTRPSAVLGRSWALNRIPIVPFWPWRVLNLSPNSGVLSCVMRIFISNIPRLFTVTTTDSTRPDVHTCGVKEESLIFPDLS